MKKSILTTEENIQIRKDFFKNMYGLLIDEKYSNIPKEDIIFITNEALRRFKS